MEEFEIEADDGVSLKTEVRYGKNNPVGTVLLCHGITSDMDESGNIFGQFAEKASQKGFDVIRFSYRGHGESEGDDIGVTISGEMLDLKSVYNYAEENLHQPITIIAASFGAVSTCLSLPYISDSLNAIALWNPVLDLEETFLDPHLPWGERNFTGEQIDLLHENGYLRIDESFKVNRVMFEEFNWYDPYEYYVNSELPSIIIHGDQDDLVPYQVSASAASEKLNCDLVTLQNTGHGLNSAEEDIPDQAKKTEAIEATINWLEDTY
jgi:pimeloyl-ACP methyl ester carboxylesterase